MEALKRQICTVVKTPLLNKRDFILDMKSKTSPQIKLHYYIHTAALLATSQKPLGKLSDTVD